MEGEPARGRPSSAWRISTRSNGATSCVEAIARDDQISVRSSIARDPTLTVAAADWERFLDEVRTGHLDYQSLGAERVAGPFIVGRADDGVVELRTSTGPQVVRYTRLEWDVFVAGVVHEAEFTVDWLQRLEATPSA